MNLNIIYIPISILFTLAPIILHTQSYKKHVPAQNLHQLHLSSFSNGDLLIANSSTALFNTGREEGIIQLQRIDACGNTIWSFQYRYLNGFLELNDAVLDAQDNIYTYGTIFTGSEEQLFIFKSDASGLDAKIKVFDTTTIDHFSYSIDNNQDGLLISGLLLDVAADRVGFIGRLSFDLDITSLITFSPIAKTGKAILTVDKHITMSSGSYIYQFDERNERQWAKQFSPNTEIIAGPFHSAGQTLLAISIDAQSYILSIDDTGMITGQTSIGESDILRGSFSGRKNSQSLLSYAVQSQNNLSVNTLTIDNNAGFLTQQNLGVTENLFSESFDTVNENDRLIIIGNARNQNEDLGDYLFQVSLSEADQTCHNFITELGETGPNDTVNWSDLELDLQESTFSALQTINLNPEPFILKSTDVCNSSQQLSPIINTNQLECGDRWDVSLPSDDYTWVDGFESTQRLITVGGIYIARSRNCDSREPIEYHLEIEPCECRVYLPTSFSPNGDGLHDQFELGISCDFIQMEILIYDRWGSLFFNRHMSSAWDGSLSELIITPGIYGVRLRYDWIDNDGKSQSKQLIQTLTVIQ